MNDRTELYQRRMYCSCYPFRRYIRSTKIEIGALQFFNLQSGVYAFRSRGLHLRISLFQRPINFFPNELAMNKYVVRTKFVPMFRAGEKLGRSAGKAVNCQPRTSAPKSAVWYSFYFITRRSLQFSRPSGCSFREFSTFEVRPLNTY